MQKTLKTLDGDFQVRVFDRDGVFSDRVLPGSVDIREVAAAHRDVGARDVAVYVRINGNWRLFE